MAFRRGIRQSPGRRQYLKGCDINGKVWILISHGIDSVTSQTAHNIQRGSNVLAQLVLPKLLPLSGYALAFREEGMLLRRSYSEAVQHMKSYITSSSSCQACVGVTLEEDLRCEFREGLYLQLLTWEKEKSLN